MLINLFNTAKLNIQRFAKMSLLLGLILSLHIGCANPAPLKTNQVAPEEQLDTLQTPPDTIKEIIVPPLDTALYNRKVLHLAHDTVTASWPVKSDYPLNGALLPFNRIVAYYGNLYTANMGILGSKPSDEMLKKLMAEVKKWEEADSTTPVIPALHYITVTAQPEPGPSSKYRLRMPYQQIDKVLELASQINAIVILDIQVGHSTLKEEIPQLKKYLMMPNVHLGIDPEYSMKSGAVPCRQIGTFDAEDINYASTYLADLVKENNLIPKLLIVHRFTQGMVTNYKKIKTRPEVQIVMDMDGFGFPAKKIDSYRRTITREPVQFTGFKLFYKNDNKDGFAMMKPKDVLNLYPRPIYIQYQ
jgi:hypothetical protein